MKRVRRATVVSAGLVLVVSLVWMSAGGAPVAAQTPTSRADTSTLAPEMSTSQPIANTLPVQINQAQSETESLSGDDGPGVPAGIVAGAAAAAAIILAGIAYRIVRGRPRTE